MPELEGRKIQCPYCGETIEILIDCSVSEQDYIEDCQVCCHPIDFYVSIDEDGNALVSVAHENE